VKRAKLDDEESETYPETPMAPMVLALVGGNVYNFAGASNCSVSIHVAIGDKITGL